MRRDVPPLRCTAMTTTSEVTTRRAASSHVRLHENARKLHIFMAEVVRSDDHDDYDDDEDEGATHANSITLSHTPLPHVRRTFVVVCTCKRVPPCRVIVVVAKRGELLVTMLPTFVRHTHTHFLSYPARAQTKCDSGAHVNV